jgi:glycosyltransferase involved in cell wall biosynthesis
VKLVMLIHSLAGGGAERVCATLANEWAKQQHEVVLLTLAGQSEDFYELVPSVRRRSLNLARPSQTGWEAIKHNIDRLRQIRAVLRAERPDVAVSFMPVANCLLGLAGKGLPVPTVGAERSYPPMLPMPRQWQWLRRYAYPMLDKVVAQTTHSRDWLQHHIGLKEVAVIPNPAVHPLPSQPPHVSPDSVLSKGPTLLATGRLGEEKQFGWLIDVFAGLTPQFPDWQLAILGEGAMRPQLERQAADNGLAGRVHLPGAVGNVNDWYAAADLYALTSRFEGFPNTLVEALSHGLPAVSVDCLAGPRDILRHEVDGLLVPPDDGSALSAALARLMGNPTLRQQFAARAVEIRQRLALADVAAAWQQVFDDVQRA